MNQASIAKQYLDIKSYYYQQNCVRPLSALET